MWHVGCMPHHQATWRELNRRHSMWVACRVIKQHGGKEKADMACGLHAASSIVLPKFGSEPKFEPEPLGLNSKFSSRFSQS